MAPLIGIGLPAGFIVPAQAVNTKLQNRPSARYWVRERKHDDYGLPTGLWTMWKSLLRLTFAGSACPDPRRASRRRDWQSGCRAMNDRPDRAAYDHRSSATHASHRPQSRARISSV